jgi:hypothetical protein
MAKSSSNNGSGELMSSKISLKPYVSTDAETQVSVDSESNSTYNYEEGTVSLRSLYDGRLEYTGQFSGKQYVWDKAGSTVEVSEYDANYLLDKRYGKNPCCGSLRDGSPLFEKVN